LSLIISKSWLEVKEKPQHLGANLALDHIFSRHCFLGTTVIERLPGASGLKKIYIAKVS
jgi:hypothetical protein